MQRKDKDRKNDIERLVVALQNDDPAVVIEAITELSKLNDARVVELLIGLTRHNIGEIRAAAVEALGKIGDEKAIYPLTALLGDDILQVQESLAKFGTSAITPLLFKLRDENDKVRQNAAQTLAKMGDVSIQPLSEMLYDSDWRVRKAAAVSLEGINKDLAAQSLRIRPNEPNFQSLRIRPNEPNFQSLRIRPNESNFQSLLVKPNESNFQSLLVRPNEPNFQSLLVKPNEPNFKVPLDTVPSLYNIASAPSNNLHFRLDEEEAATAALNADAPDTSELRYADFTFYSEDGNINTRVLDGHVLCCDYWYQMEVAVRVKPTGIPTKEQERLPIHVPKQANPVTIMVTAEDEGDGFFEIEEPVQMLVLPPHGDSVENGYFRVRPLRQSANSDDLAKIRVRLYYEFNLLEVDVVCAEVVGKFDNPSQSKLGLERPLSFRQERLEREYIDFDEVEPRAMHVDITKQGDSFLFNFAFYNDGNQKVEFTAPVRLPAADLEDALISIRKTLYDVAMSKTFTDRLEGDEDEFVVNIRKIAKAGRNLWTKLFKYEHKSAMFKIGKWLEKHPIKQEGIIQISLDYEAINFVFPWALLYDRPVPKKEYELPDIQGFWGLRYCIEQQLPNKIKDTDKPVHIEDDLKLGFMLWEQFRNADKQKYLMESLMVQSSDKLEVSIPPITDADACFALLNKCDAHILYFFTHGYTRHRQADIGVGQNLESFESHYNSFKQDDPRRELWKFLYESIKQEQFEPDRSWIELTYGKLYLDELYDGIQELQSKPFVFLNMCESAQITPSLSDSFVHFFLDRGAKGIIGTECPMTVEFAHPFAEKFLKELLTGEKVGIALLNARRHFMHLKNPLGLAYTLFGSATVCFEPPSLKLPVAVVSTT